MSISVTLPKSLYVTLKVLGRFEVKKSEMSKIML
ncbi:hypothetical protein J2Z80_002981 [Thermoanaerobacterium butyriciformans]|uniref:Uncharacterized protein n=1 Tax=Thermoanaerobacterium butyriciformans TaxID=1702242 RepID=A0ABS4NIE9_9THEO|nr:hypothetical protein [Thermoanaerobacterium butyriciformans]